MAISNVSEKWLKDVPYLQASFKTLNNKHGPMYPNADYAEFCKPELGEAIHERNLRKPGNKDNMLASLLAYDKTHFFDFQGLPLEIRRKIYRLAASTTYITDQETMPSKYMNQRDYDGILGVFRVNNGSMSRAPGFFYADKQTAAEGLPEFYQSRRFTFSTYHRKLKPQFQAEYCDVHPFDAISRWLNSIGVVGRMNIRYLTVIPEEYCSIIRLSPKPMSIELIHDHLSEKATVVYMQGQVSRRFPDKEDLWDFGRNFKKTGISAVPQLRVLGKHYPCNKTAVMPKDGRWDKSTALVFRPDTGWFKNDLVVAVTEVLKLDDANKHQAKDLKEMTKKDLDAATVRVHANISARQRIVAEWERQDHDQLEALRKAAMRKQQNEEVMAVRGEGLQEE